ncbi:hypothetical protein E1267_43510 [Nonomuraea longispora]|uniref:Uncharacterized protein n=1 Tax=Nonomuraea longispora TaxID=1848320 RepID=A0A4R4MJ97_9ACTN|nr:hypothetical protein E1267_43510 [Nonomuraea longispora]
MPSSDPTTDAGDAPTPATSVLRVGVGGLAVDEKGLARATVSLRTSGTEPVVAVATWRARGTDGRVQRVRLSGATSYTRTLAHPFRSRPCGATLSVTVRAGGRTATARTTVSCPPAVTRVSVRRAAVSGGALAATVAVTTSDAQRVRLTVAFAAGGERLGTRTVTLSGATSYTMTLRLPVELGCGSTWTVTAATVPAAGNGGSTASGSTPACPKEEPDDQPSHSPRPESPGTIR